MKIDAYSTFNQLKSDFYTINRKQTHERSHFDQQEIVEISNTAQERYDAQNASEALDNSDVGPISDDPPSRSSQNDSLEPGAARGVLGDTPPIEPSVPYNPNQN